LEIIINNQPEPSTNVTAVSHISGKDTKTNAFQKKLYISCTIHVGSKPTNIMTDCPPSRVAGAWNRIQIPFLDLQLRY